MSPLRLMTSSVSCHKKYSFPRRHVAVMLTFDEIECLQLARVIQSRGVCVCAHVCDPSNNWKLGCRSFDVF